MYFVKNKNNTRYHMQMNASIWWWNVSIVSLFRSDRYDDKWICLPWADASTVRCVSKNLINFFPFYEHHIFFIIFCGTTNGIIASLFWTSKPLEVFSFQMKRIHFRMFMTFEITFHDFKLIRCLNARVYYNQDKPTYSI